MSVVRYITPTNRLAKLIVAAGGKTVDDAVADAETNLAGVAEACLGEIDSLIGQLVRRAAEVSSNPGQEDVLYTGSREIAGLAAICKRPALGEAAHSLCILIDECVNGGRWRKDAVSVHIATLQLIRNIPDEAESVVPNQLLGSLKDMVGRLTD